jgi:hypothetical protein
MTTDHSRRYAGGCLCGALRYEAKGQPLYQGHCYCSDCRKATGSGFVGFMGFPASSLRFSGEAVVHASPAASGEVAERSRCAVCHSLVFGGRIGQASDFTIYAGSLDDASLFEPDIAIFSEGRPDWAMIPPDLQVFRRGPE